MNRREIQWDVMDWIDLAQDRYQWRAITPYSVREHDSLVHKFYPTGCLSCGYTAKLIRINVRIWRQ
jgi:hypothetical protein